jgi:hypothetical protein
MLLPDDIKVKRQWRLRWLSMIFEFSHIEYQRSLWLERKVPSHGSWYGEDVCQYFDDLYLDDDYQNQLQDNFVTKEEYEVIKPFHFTFREFNSLPESNLTEELILQSPNWKSVVQLGLQSWSKLKEVIKDQEEKVHMLGLETNYLTARTR